MVDQPTDEPGASARADADERARSVAEQTSSAVRLAAEVLEEEVSAGVQEARQLQRTLMEQRRLEPGDLEAVAARVRRNAHQLIDLVAERLVDLRADDVQDLGQRFAKDAHEVFDAVMDLVDTAPDLVNRLVERADEMTRPSGDQADGGDAPEAAPRARARKAAAQSSPARSSATKKTATKSTAKKPSAGKAAAGKKAAGKKAAAKTAASRPASR